MNIADCCMVNGFRQSMSANDNAQAESFFSRFKTELIEDGTFESVEQAKSEIFSYIKDITIASGGIQVWAT